MGVVTQFFSGALCAPDVGTTLSQILNPPLMCLCMCCLLCVCVCVRVCMCVDICASVSAMCMHVCVTCKCVRICVVYTHSCFFHVSLCLPMLYITSILYTSLHFQNCINVLCMYTVFPKKNVAASIYFRAIYRNAVSVRGQRLFASF